MGVAAGEAVSLAGISDANGRFAVLAIDHRDSLREFLSPGDPSAVSAAEITALKIHMVQALGAEATGVMLEPEYSIPHVLDAGVLPDGVGFLAALESQGYLGDPGAAPTTVLDGWSVEAAAASGASCAKLLLPYQPDRPLAAAQEEVAREVLAECRRVGIPLVLEPLFYDLDDASDRTRVVLTTATRFAAINPDLLKLPFPVDAGHDQDTDHWFAACRTISELAHMPWVLLSGGGSFEAFAAQLTVAVDAGCAGFMVGRALWGEAALAPRLERQGLLDTTVRHRMKTLRGIVCGPDPT
jgi:tagatose-1,6-bisphosphate aldolase